MSTRNQRRVQERYGIGEWYGRSFIRLTADERREFAQHALATGKDTWACLPRGGAVTCTKHGGVCSLRLYRRDLESGLVESASGDRGRLVTTCPYRFLESSTIFRWIGEKILDCPEPVIVGELGFLERESTATGQPSTGGREDVGRIDNVLVRPDAEPMVWCALEIQAVYFSGSGMPDEFRAVLRDTEALLPFPSTHRRPDFRSSGPKRLMPQLQIKVPALRRWGKKMAVVVDEAFFGALGQMDHVQDISNCDIAWFVVHYEEGDGEARLQPGQVHLTTLERAVEGLTAGHPVSLHTFEERLRNKQARQAVNVASLDLG